MPRLSNLAARSEQSCGVLSSAHCPRRINSLSSSIPPILFIPVVEVRHGISLIVLMGMDIPCGSGNVDSGGFTLAFLGLETGSSAFGLVIFSSNSCPPLICVGRETPFICAELISDYLIVRSNALFQIAQTRLKAPRPPSLLKQLKHRNYEQTYTG